MFEVRYEFQENLNELDVALHSHQDQTWIIPRNPAVTYCCGELKRTFDSLLGPRIFKDGRHIAILFVDTKWFSGLRQTSMTGRGRWSSIYLSRAEMQGSRITSQELPAKSLVSPDSGAYSAPLSPDSPSRSTQCHGAEAAVREYGLASRKPMVCTPPERGVLRSCVDSLTCPERARKAESVALFYVRSPEPVGVLNVCG